MAKITNLTAGPFDLQGVHGMVRLPAFGAVEGEFSGEYLDVLRASGAVAVADVAAPAARGDAPQGERQDDAGAGNLAALREEYEALTGKAPDRRWAEGRVLTEIEKLKG